MVAPAPFAGIKEKIPLMTILKTFGSSFSWNFWNKPVDRSFSGTSYGVFDDDFPFDERMKIYESLVWESGDVLLELALRKTIIKDYDIYSKCMVLAGTKDRLIPLPIAKEIADYLKAEYHEYFLPHYMMGLKQIDESAKNNVLTMYEDIKNFLLETA